VGTLFNFRNLVAHKTKKKKWPTTRGKAIEELGGGNDIKQVKKTLLLEIGCARPTAL